MRRALTFADRVEAGRLLARRIERLDLPQPLVLGLPRGGVAVAAEIARALAAPLDVALVRKLGAPDQPELAVGAVADAGDDDPAPQVVLNAEALAALGIDAAYLTAAVARERALIARRRAAWAPLRPCVAAAGRSVVVVDDGAATGMTMQAALRQLRLQQPARLLAAVPVASREAAAMLRREADRLVCLSTPRRFTSVGAHYLSFAQVTDDEVAAFLRAAAR